jgi:hypothetical protein
MVGEQGQIEDPAACRARNERFRTEFASSSAGGRPHEAVLAEPI